MPFSCFGAFFFFDPVDCFFGRCSAIETAPTAVAVAVVVLDVDDVFAAVSGHGIEFAPTVAPTAAPVPPPTNVPNPPPVTRKESGSGLLCYDLLPSRG